MTDKITILFATPVLHYPAEGGPHLRIENSIKALSQISDLYVYSRVSLNSLGGSVGLNFYQKYCCDFYFAPSCSSPKTSVQFVTRALNYFSKKTLGFNVVSIRQNSKNDFQHLLKTARTIKADIIWLGFGNISYPFLKYIKSHSSFKVVVDTDSVWSRFILRGVPYAKDADERVKIEQQGIEKAEEERWGTLLADATTAVSEVDATYYRGLAQNPYKVHLFSNVIDIDNYRHISQPAKDFEKPCIYLAGSFWPNSPMEDAARWVINEVLPIVRQEISQVHFYIVGKGSDQILNDINDPGITITGKLPSVLPYLCHVDASLVPLRFESGTRFKILEAGACGIPVVSTTLGAEGIPVTTGKDILIADEPKLFAESIIKLLKAPTLANKMGENLKKLVNAKYSVASLVEEGRLILEYLTS